MELTMILNWLPCPSILMSLAVPIVCITIAYFVSKHRNLPPGPTGLPYLGYWPFLSNENVTAKFAEMMKKYGDIFSITITGRLFIHLGTIQALRDVHVAKADCFDGRIPSPNLLAECFEAGTGFARGERWKVLRRFFLSAMNERAVLKSRNCMLEPVYDSIKSTINDVKEKRGQPVNFTELLIDKCTTNLRLMVFSDVGASQEQVRKIARLNLDQVRGFTPMNFILSGRFARYFILPFHPEFCKALKSHEELENVLWDIVKEHKATYDEENIRDMIDDYFKERDFRRRKGDPTAEYFTDVCLIKTLSQIVADGIVSVASGISIFIKFLTEKPEEQDKLYEEILRVVGPDRQPTVEDKSKLKYLNAFIYEGLRMSNVFCIFPGWECIKETTVNGYKIPKGAVTLLNFYAYKHTTHEESQKFNPSRFLSEDGERRTEQPTTFGVGKRTCLGEGYSMMQFFLFLATIIQNFKLTLPDEASMSSRDIYMKGCLYACAHPRKHS